MIDSFPSEGEVQFIEAEADRLNAARRSRATSLLCRCTAHEPGECGNTAESLPDRPLCWPCWTSVKRIGLEGHRASIERMRAGEVPTHCTECGGTLVVDFYGVIKCAACGEAMAL